MSEDLNKVTGKTELSDEDLEWVAGGVYSQEEWYAMSTAERRAAQLRSLKARAASEPCELD